MALKVNILNKYLQTATFIDPAKSLFVRKRRILSGAGNEIRTRDSKLGKLALYQLSYARHQMLLFMTVFY